jgi:cell shape-determining protein MreD
MKLLAFTFLIIALVLEASLTTIPFVFLVLLCLLVLLRENWLFAFAFGFGLVLDLVTFKTPGASSAFFVTFLFLVLIYQSKFEIATNTFIFFASLFGSFGYLVFLGYSNSLILQTILSSIIGLALFKLIQKLKIHIYG